MKIPTFEGGRKGVDLYKIPQPTSVDINYEVRLFCNRMRDLNKFNVKIQQAFNAIEYYIRVNGHPMPLFLESIGDESNVDDFENRRFYVQPFEINLRGYVLDEDKFEVVPAINRALVFTEVEDLELAPILRVSTDKSEAKAFYNFIFKPRASNKITYTADFDLKYKKLTNILGVTNIKLSVNGVEKLNGLSIGQDIIISANDTITIQVTKNFYSEGKFTLIGLII